MTAAVQLVLPGLFDLPLHELEPGFVDAELPSLNRLLGLATPRMNRDYSIDAMLGSALGLSLSAPALPMAQAFADGDVNGERLLLIEAIHLQADLHNAIAMPIPKNAENKKDIDILFKDLEGLFKVDFDVFKNADGVYLLRLKAFDAPTHYPHPLSVLGKSINPFIEQSRQVLPWYQLLNEVQMFLHQHVVNERRLQQGKPAINSIWAWGAGEPIKPASLPAWYGDDAALNQFAAALGLTVAGLGDLTGDADFEHALIVDLRLLQLLKAGLDSPLDGLLLDIEHNLLGPLMKALAKRRAALHLRAGYRVDFELKPRAGLKFWRRPGSLADWVE